MDRCPNCGSEDTIALRAGWFRRHYWCCKCGSICQYGTTLVTAPEVLDAHHYALRIAKELIDRSTRNGVAIPTEPAK